MRILLYESFSIYSCLNLNFLHFQIFYGIEKKILLGLLSAIHVTRAGMPLRKHVQFFFKKKQVREEGIGIESGTFSLQRMGAEPKNYCRQGFEIETRYVLQEIF